jgi:hypothetical protein
MGVPESSKHIDCDSDQTQRCSQLVSVNYCRPGIMSRCSAGIVWEKQKKCRFSKKSSVSERCMHYIASRDGHCDSVDAQRESYSPDRI